MSVQQLPASTVHVMLGDCSAADARSVLAVLSGRFTADREGADEPHESELGRPTVWTALFDTAGDQEVQMKLRLDSSTAHETRSV